MNPNFTPSVYQQAIFDDIMFGEGNTVIDAVAGSGKCLGIDTPVLMYDGSIIPVQDIKEGDMLMGMDSTPRTVTSTTIGVGELFNIVPVKGDSFVCNDVHVMTLVNSVTDEVFDVPLDEYMATSGTRKHKNAKLFRVPAVFDNNDVLPIAPYLFGAWLGDGTYGESQITTGEPEIIEYCKNIASAYGLECVQTPEKNHFNLRFKVGVRGTGHRVNGNKFREFFRYSTRNGEKRITGGFLTSSVEDRMELLAGLLDTDGYMHKNCYEITTKYKGLNDDILFLARSLGFAAYSTYTEKGIKSTGFKGMYYRISISGDTYKIPCKVERRKATKRAQKKNVLRTGFSVESAGVGNYYGFTLDGDGRFLLGDFTVTHNTTTIKQALHYIDPSKKVRFVAFNKHIQVELAEDVPDNVEVSTMHSMGFAGIKKVQKRKLVQNKLFQITSEVSKKYPSLSKDESKALFSLVLKVVPLLKGELMEPTDKNIDAICYKHGIEIPTMATYNFVKEVMQASIDEEYEIDFDDMIYKAVIENAPIETVDWLFVDEAQDLNAAQVELLMMAVGPDTRVVAVGDPYQCHPPGTMITLTGGDTIPIEEIKEGMEVVTYHTGSSSFRGINTQGRKVEGVASRPYNGLIHRFSTDMRCTPNHKILVKWGDKADNKHIVYLMRKGDSFRIGHARAVYMVNGSRNAGLAMRCRHEDADEGWILSVHSTSDESFIHEQVVQAQFGLAGTPFKSSSGKHKDQWVADKIYEVLGDSTSRAIECLSGFGRDINYPMWCKEKRNDGCSSLITRPHIIRACNFIPDFHAMKVYCGSKIGLWEYLDVKTSYEQTTVYSLKVQPTEGGKRLYIADNTVVHNCLYGFRGADTDAMEKLTKRLNAKQLPLSICYRCPNEHLELARTFVPHIESNPDHAPGQVHDIHVDLLGEYVAPEDLCICRYNAPLVRPAFDLLRQGIKVCIRGRDIGTSLIKLIDQMKTRDIDTLFNRLYDWRNDQIAKAEKKGANPQAIEDKYDTIVEFIESNDFRDTEELKGYIKDLFSDDRAQVTFSSIHKAKGLEADNVFIIAPETMPSKYASQDWEIQQEANVQYVALTRAKQDLYFVRS